MSVHTYSEIVNKANTCTKTVKTKYELGVDSKWSYYFAKAVITPKKDIKRIDFKHAPKPSGTHISRQITRAEYIQLAKDLVKFVETKKRLPNYLKYKNYRIRTRLYTYILAKAVYYQNKDHKQRNELNANSKAFTKPLEASNEVYKYFCKVFNNGKKIMTIDEALQKIQSKGYGYYYDDVLSNKQTIDGLAHKTNKRPNCTDSCQMTMNIVLQLIIWGIYKKVECLHVNCQSGGHVKLRITRNDGSTFIRDVACIISDNGKPLTCVWCTNTPKAVNPSWFMSNLNR